MNVESSTFTNNYAFGFGGALYLSGYLGVSLSKGTKFTYNDALRYSGDIYAINSKYDFIISDTIIENFKSTNSLYLDSVSFKA